MLFRYVSLSDNEKTGFKARELKSVHVDAVGSYLKLTFHRNHVNQYNNYNQVQIHVGNQGRFVYCNYVIAMSHVFLNSRLHWWL